MQIVGSWSDEGAGAWRISRLFPCFVSLILGLVSGGFRMLLSTLGGGFIRMGSDIFLL